MSIEAERIAREVRAAPALDQDPRAGTRPLGSTALGPLGIELLTCERTIVAVRVRVPDGARGSAFGVLLVAAETAASTAANLRCADGKRAFGAELNAASIRTPAAGATIVVVASELHVGDTRHGWRITAWDERDELVLEGRCTLGVVAIR